MTILAVKIAAKRALSFVSPQLDRLWKKQDALRAEINVLRGRSLTDNPDSTSYVNQLASV